MRMGGLSSELDVETEVSRILSRIGAVKFGTFRLTSGKLSPYYIDLRVVPSFPGAFRRICQLYVDFINKELGDNFDRIAGIPTAGIPFAAVIAYNMDKPFLYVRKGFKRHGRERRIEGVLTSGDKVLLVDDLVTTGSSLRAAARVIRAEGGVVEDAVVLIDREEGGADALARDGIKLHSLLKITSIARKLYEMGVVTDEQLETILKQVKG